MIKNININYDSFRDQILESLSTDNQLRLDTSNTSFIYKIIDTLAAGQSDVFDSINQMIDNNTFENLTGDSLDTFFEMFNITRLEHSYGETIVELTYIGTDVFTVPAGTNVLFNGSNYVTSFDVMFENYNGVNGIKLVLKGIDNEIEITTGIQIGTDLLIGIETISHNLTDNFVLINNVMNKITLNDFYVNSEAIETDANFLNRSKNLLQKMSSNSIEKIMTAIKDNVNIVDVKNYREGLTDKLIIIPQEVGMVDDVYNASQEIVNYFSSNNVILQKPNYVEFDITGVLSQLDDGYINQTSIFINNYISTVRTDHKIDRNDFDFRILEFIRGLIAEDSTINFDRNKINIVYRVYAKSNLDALLFTGSIYENQYKEFSDSVYACNTIG